MQSQTAVVIGATGLIGSKVVETLLKDTAFDRVRMPVRKAFPVTAQNLKCSSLTLITRAIYHKKSGKEMQFFVALELHRKK